MSDALLVIRTILSTVHWLPVVAVTLFSLFVGAIWNLSSLFGRIRASEQEPGAGRRRNRVIVSVVSSVLLLITFINLSLVVSGTGAIAGLLTSLQISIVWVATAIGVLYLFSGRSWRLIAIDAGLCIILYSLGGLALGSI